MLKIHNLKGLLIPFIIAFIMLGGYFYYWNNLGENIKSSIAKNKNYTYDALSITGFPYRETLEVKGFKYKSFETKTIIATTSPFNPRIWVLEGMEAPKLNGQELVTDKFQASLRIEPDNEFKIKRLSIIFDSLKQNGKEIMGKTAFHLVRDEDHNRFGLSFETNYQLSSLEGDKTNLIIRGPINNANDFDKGLENWSKNGGNLKIEYFTLFSPIVNFDKGTGTLTCLSINTCNGEVTGDLRLNIKTLNLNYSASNSKINIENSKLLPLFDTSKLIH